VAWGNSPCRFEVRDKDILLHPHIENNKILKKWKAILGFHEKLTVEGGVLSDCV